MFSQLLRGARDVAVMHHRLEDMDKRLNGVITLHTDTRERVIAIEAYLNGLAAGRGLDPPRLR